MLAWRRAKADVSVVQKYRDDVFELWRMEGIAADSMTGSMVGWGGNTEYQSALQRKASLDPHYQVVRDRVARATNRMKRIARQNGVPVDLKSFPPPAVGGPVIPINYFDAVLFDHSYGGVSNQWIVDALNQTMGESVERVDKEFWKLLNPLQWAKDLLVSVLRIPFLLIESTGFDVAKVEEHLFGKLFKFAELGVLLWIAFRLGFDREQIKALFEKLVK